MRRLIILICCLLVLPFLNLARSSAQWKPIGPRGGYVERLVPDRNQANVWYTINSGSLYRSGDGGKSWRKLMDRVTDFAIHPKTSEILVVAVGNSWSERKLYRAGKNAFTFRLVNSKTSIVRIFWDPKKTNHLYALGFYDEPFGESSDGGSTWNFHYHGPDLYFDLEDLVISPSDPRTIYIRGTYYGDPCCNEAETIVSHNGGDTWDNSSFIASQFAQDSLYPDEILATGYSHSYGFVLAQLSGQKWIKLGDSPPQLISMVPGEPKELFGLAGSQIEKSPDFGKTWQPFEAIAGYRNQIAIADDPAKSILLGGNGIFKRTGKNTWMAMNQGFGSSEIQQIVRIPNPGVVIASPDYDQIYSVLYRKDESKSYWLSIFQTSRSRTAYGRLIAGNPADNGQVFLVTSDRLHVSNDAGRKWQECQGFGSRIAINSVEFAPSDSRVFYAVQGNRLYRSQDRGLHFAKMSSLEAYFQKLIIDPRNDSQVYLIAYDGIYVSKNQGKSFSFFKAPSGQDLSVAAPLPDLDALLVVGGYPRNVYRFQLSSGKWEKIGSVEGYASTLVPADNHGLHFYMIASYRLLESNDGEVSWNAAPGLGSKVYVNDMTDARYPPIYLATYQGVLMQK